MPKKFNQAIDLNETHILYGVQVANLKRTLAKLSSEGKIKGLEDELHHAALETIRLLDHYPKYDTNTPHKENEISLVDATSLIKKMNDIIEHYLQAKKKNLNDTSKQNFYVANMRKECQALAEQTDKIFDKKIKSDEVKKILGTIGLFVAAGLLIAGLITLVAATHGGILSGAVPMLIANSSVASFLAPAMLAVKSTVVVGLAPAITAINGLTVSTATGITSGFLAKIAAGGIMTTLAGYGFFRSVTKLQSGMKTKPHHQLSHFAQTGDKLANKLQSMEQPAPKMRKK